MVYGAIAGDIIGSRFEFDRGPWTKDFELFTEESNFTDDTVMTIAVASALSGVDENTQEQDVKKLAVESMQKWGRLIPNAGYGASFIYWIWDDDPTPYNSFGNGSAMRTSAVGWKFDNLDRTREVARWIAEVSHNHPEGIKGAEATASAIWMARNGYTQDEITIYMVEEFGYDLSKLVDELRPLHKHMETCMDAMPKALVSFYESTSFEDAIRNAVSLGGDTDTIAAITGSIAEAFYGVPRDIEIACNNILGENLSRIVDLLDKED